MHCFMTTAALLLLLLLSSARASDVALHVSDNAQSVSYNVLADDGTMHVAHQPNRTLLIDGFLITPPVWSVYPTHMSAPSCYSWTQGLCIQVELSSVTTASSGVTIEWEPTAFRLTVDVTSARADESIVVDVTAVTVAQEALFSPYGYAEVARSQWDYVAASPHVSREVYARTLYTPPDELASFDEAYVPRTFHASFSLDFFDGKAVLRRVEHTIDHAGVVVLFVMLVSSVLCLSHIAQAYIQKD